MLLAYDQSTGQSAIRSFGPDHSQASVLATGVGLPVPGTDSYGFENIKTPDDIQSNFVSITVQTTPEEAQAVIQAIITHPDGNYTTYFNNCTTTCSKLLRSIGKTKSHALTPAGFFNDLYDQYAVHHGGKVGPNFVPGQKYGQLRPGYDPFQLFFNDIPQTHEKVTSKIVDWHPLPDQNQ